MLLSSRKDLQSLLLDIGASNLIDEMLSLMRPVRKGVLSDGLAEPPDR